MDELLFACLCGLSFTGLGLCLDRYYGHVVLDLAADTYAFDKNFVAGFDT